MRYRIYIKLQMFLIWGLHPPSREEIAMHLGLSGIMAAQRSIQRLKASKKVSFDKNSKRAIELTATLHPIPGRKVRPPDSHQESNGFVELPFLGFVAAGRPIEAIEQAESIQVPQHLIRATQTHSRNHQRHFVLKVVGDSMIEDHICDGDWIIVREQSSATNGDRVIALINNEATLKRFYQKTTHIELHPANSSMRPIIIEPHQHLRIAGIYVGLMRGP